MEVNKHINFLKRRGFLIKESEQMSLFGEDPITLNFKHLCNGGGKVFCRLLDLADEEGIKNDPMLSKKLVDSITKIFEYLKPPLKDNRSKFTRLVNIILNQKMENAINTFRIIADVIDNVNVSKLRKSLDKLSGNKTLTDEELFKTINDIKHASYTEYENSFIGDHFSVARKSMELSYRGDEVLKDTFTQMLSKTIDTDGDYERLASSLHKAIITNFQKGVGKFIKADLQCVKPLLDENGITIIDVGDFVEVKKLDYKGDSYLSEFFGIYKSPKELIKKDKRLLTDEGKLLYNKVIDTLYLKLRSGVGQEILDTIRNNFTGIIYDENRFISKEHIHLYWSNKGQRTEDHRLTIRYKIMDSQFNGYIYDPNSDVLKTETMGIDSVSQLVFLPLTVDGSPIKENFDWVTDHMETIPDDPKVMALIQHLGYDEVLGEDFDPDGYEWYGNHNIYTLNNGEEWVVGTTDSMDDALYHYLEDYVHDVGIDELGMNLEDFIIVSDDWKDSFAEDEADNYVNDLYDNDLLEQTDKWDEYEELGEKYEELDGEIDGLKSEIWDTESRIEDMESDNEESPDTHNEESIENAKYFLDDKLSKLDDLENQQLDIDSKKEELIEEAKEITRQDHYDMWIECLDDPFYCFIYEHGWFSNAKELVDSMGWDLDEESLIEYYSQDGYNIMSGYHSEYYEETVGDETYILIRVG